MSSTANGCTSNAMRRTGAQIVWEVLTAEGVDVVFGYPGRRDHAGLRRHARVPRSITCSSATSRAPRTWPTATRAPRARSAWRWRRRGPGATNLVTGHRHRDARFVADRVHHRAGAVASCIGSDAFQETDITGVTLPITKHNFLVTRVEEIAPTLRAGVLHRAQRAAGAGAGRHHQGRAAGRRASSSWDEAAAVSRASAIARAR